jgi:nicotinate-nucleotide pyrophosphorylase (carboxylating)
MNFSSAEREACLGLIDLGLKEDLGNVGDVTSKTFIPVDLQGKAIFVAREAGVLAGSQAAELVFGSWDATSVSSFCPLLEDGASLMRGARLATVAGPMRGILAGERTALNFMQRLSGIATQTRKYVDTVAGLPCRILDTRKTMPGWRLLEKYAVRCGGGHNHRFGLYDGILLKDNHLSALLQKSGQPSIADILRTAQRNGVWHVDFLEIEVENLKQFDEALAGHPDIILLDNMALDDMREAVRRRQARAPEVKLEASGGVNIDTVRAIAETGVDRISVGALTHSAPALDIALDYEAS